MDQKSQDEIAGLKLDLQVANHKLNMANQTIADLESRVVQGGMVQVSEYEWQQWVFERNTLIGLKSVVKHLGGVNDNLKQQNTDYLRRIRQLEDEQAEYSETAMYARIHELEAVVEQYEKQVTAIRKAVNREIEK